MVPELVSTSRCHCCKDDGKFFEHFKMGLVSTLLIRFCLHFQLFSKTWNGWFTGRHCHPFQCTSQLSLCHAITAHFSRKWDWWWHHWWKEKKNCWNECKEIKDVEGGMALSGEQLRQVQKEPGEHVSAKVEIDFLCKYWNSQWHVILMFLCFKIMLKYQWANVTFEPEAEKRCI